VFKLQNLNIIEIIKHATFKVLTAIIMKNKLFWVIIAQTEPDVLEEQMPLSSRLKEEAKQIPAKDDSTCCLLLLVTHASY
jgi:hypothetical protein